MKIIDLINKIAQREEVPKQIKVYGMIWTYEEGFDQYKNSRFQELIKYLGGFYEDCPIGITYRAIFNLKVEPIEEDEEIEHHDMFDYFTGYGFGGTDKDLLNHLERNFVNINQELDYLMKLAKEFKKEGKE